MPFVASAGVIDRVRPAANTLGMGFPATMQLGIDDYRTYEQMWKAQPALRTVIEFLGRNVGDLPLDVYERTDDDSRKKARDHQL